MILPSTPRPLGGSSSSPDNALSPNEQNSGKEGKSGSGKDKDDEGEAQKGERVSVGSSHTFGQWATLARQQEIIIDNCFVFAFVTRRIYEYEYIEEMW